MATSNSRDVTLTLSVDTLGEDNVKKLQASVQALAKEGGDAAPEFQKLADEIAQLGAQNTALQSFKALGDETQVLRDKQEALVQSSAQMAAKLDELRAATDAAKAGQSAASEALTAGRLAYVEAGNAIRILKTEYDASGKGTEEYRQKLNALTVAHAEAKAALVTLGAEQKATTAGASEAVSAQGKLETAYNRSVSAVNKVEAALKAQETALQQAATAANELGVSTAEIATSEAQLLSAFNAAGTAARTRAEATKEMAESDRLLAIEERGLIALLARGEQALQAEVLAQRDAARAAAEYAAAKAQATANEAKWQQEAEAIVNAAHAAQELARQTQVLAAAGKELSAQRAFEQQAEDAKKLVNAAEYVRMWETALQQADAQATATAAAASAAADKIQNAFKTVGVRSAQELQAEIVQVREAMATISAASGAAGTSLNGAFAAGEAKVRALELELRQLNGTLTLGDKATKLFANSMGQIALGNVVADAIGYLVNKVKEMGVAFIAAIVQMDQMRRGLNAIYGDVFRTASQILFLRTTAQDAGVSFGGLAKEFVKFSAAMNGAKIPLDQTNALFKAVVTSSATLGLSAEETAGSLNALGQMASKGVVQMEELRGQLGDRLPGALSSVAKGLGVTEAELSKLVESGGLAARDLFPALTKALNSMKGETDGLVPTFERLKGYFTSFATDIGDAGAVVLLGGALKLLGGFAATAALGLSTLVEAIFLVGSGVTALFARLSGDKDAFAFFSAQVENATNRLTNQANTLNSFLDPQAKYVAGQKEAAVVLGAAATATVQAATATAASGKALELQTLLAKLNADATLDLSSKHVQFSVALKTVLAVQEQQAELADKLAKAAKIEGDSLVALAKLRGDETGIREAGVAAAQLELAALEKAAVARKAVADILQIEHDELVANAAARGIAADQIKVEQAAIDKKLESSKAETEQSKQAAEAAKNDLLQRQLAVETYKNNAASVDVFRSALAAATKVLDEYQVLARQGKKTDEEVAAAKRDVARAQVLYNDSLGDAIGKIDLETRAKSANLSLSSAKYSADVQAYTLQAKNSAAIGDSAAALYYEIEAKKASIEQTKIGYQIKKLEADADLQALEIQKLQIPANDALREQKLKEIDIRMQLAKIKLVEAGAGDAVIAAMEREITTMRLRNSLEKTGAAITNQATVALDGKTSALERAVAAQEKANEVAQRTIDLENKRLGQDKNGFATDKAGNTLVAGGDLTTRTGIKAFLTSAGVKDDAAATQITNEFANSTGGIDYFNNAGQRKYGGSTISDALLKAAEKYTFSAAAVAASQAAAKPAATATAGTSSTKTVNVVINGVSTAVNVASASDQTALVSVIRQLEAAAKGTA